MGKTPIQDMPHLRKKMAKIDAERKNRLREARNNNDIKKMVENLAVSDLRPQILTPKQHEAIFLMCDFVHNYSYTTIAARLGISIDKLMEWRNNPFFLRHLDKAISQKKSFIRIHAFRNVHRAIMRGSMKDTWNYLKMSGDLKEQHEIIDKTGEADLSEEELNTQIELLKQQISSGPDPSTS